MFNYYLKLGWLSLRANPLLSLLMVCAIGVGIGACMSIITVNYTMSSNPIPHKSDQLFHVQLDSWDAGGSTPYLFALDRDAGVLKAYDTGGAGAGRAAQRNGADWQPPDGTLVTALPAGAGAVVVAAAGGWGVVAFNHARSPADTSMTGAH